MDYHYRILIVYAIYLFPLRAIYLPFQACPAIDIYGGRNVHDGTLPLLLRVAKM